MILIVSHDHIDEPTNNVIDWLNYYKADYRRVNGSDFSVKKESTFKVNNKFVIDNNKKEFFTDNISIVWYRRWLAPVLRMTNLEKYNKMSFSSEEVNLIENYHGFMFGESNSYINGIFSLFKRFECIPNIVHARGGLNKIDVLINAKEAGLLIPETLITTNKIQVLEFYKEHGDLITKPISEVAIISYQGINVAMYTRAINIVDIELFKDNFFLSLFQKKIEKAFEVRTFVHKEKVFSMAIFSQRDDKTSVDFRNYNYEKPNRNVPFLLPKKIKNNLLQLFRKLNLNTGSVDFMVDLKGDFYFLEINPVGQLGMVSIGGNYHLEKIIAEDLIKSDNEKFRN